MSPQTSLSNRIYAARFVHESNSFAPGVTPCANFRIRKGEDFFNHLNQDSVLGAVVRQGRQNGLVMVPGFDVSASPSAAPEDAVVETALRLLDETLPQALEDGLDAIFLQLHGAMASPSYPDPEGVFLDRISYHLQGRSVPVAAVLDMHANVSAAMAGPGRLLYAYRENPHTDAVESGLILFKFLRSAIQTGQKYSTAVVQVPILLPPSGTATIQNPMAGLLKLARSLECKEVPLISICPGFAHADAPDAGLSFQLIWDSGKAGRGEVEAIAKKLSDLAWELAPEGYPEEWELEAAVAAANEDAGHPALLVETADNIGGGAGGGATWVLAELLRQRVRGAGVVLADKAAIERLRGTLEGDVVELSVGGLHPDLSGPAVHLKMKVIRHWDGVFEVEDHQSHIVAVNGLRVDMGESCLLESDGLTLLLTSKPTAPMDLAQWRAAGVNPEDFRVIGIKAAVAHRRAYDKIAARSFTVSTPGSCTSQISTLPYRRLSRPIHPLDSGASGFRLHGAPCD